MRSLGVDALRGWASFWVVLFHYGLAESPWLAGRSPAAASVAGVGNLGVPMFFVISGFCIGAAAANAGRRPGGTGRFVRRRLLRIFPPFWASVAVAAAVPYLYAGVMYVTRGQFAPPPGPVETASLGEWLRVLTLTQGWGYPDDDWGKAYARFTGVYWTLGVEVQFYLVVAAALVLGRYGPAWAVVVTVASLPVAFVDDLQYPGAFPTYWVQFALGWGVYVLAARRWVWTGRLAAPAAVAAFAGLVAAAAAGVFETLPGKSGVHAFAAGTAVVVWLAVGADGALGRLKEQAWNPLGWGFRALLGLGTISYSLYLLHTLLFRLTDLFTRQVFAVGSAAHDLSSIGLVVALCVPFYYLVERPFVGGPKPAAPPPKTPS